MVFGDDEDSCTREDFREVITTYLGESRMIYLVVGDAETQFHRLKRFSDSPCTD